MASTINATTSSGIVATADNTGNLALQSAGTTIANVTSTGMAITGIGSFSGDLSFNSGYGSAAVAYGCRAWVNFNGTSTVAIRASGNVSSITDNGTGDYTVNFINAMPDVNYVGVFGPVIRSGPDANCMVRYGNAMGTYALTTTTYRFGTGEIGAGFTGQDAVAVQASFFR